MPAYSVQMIPQPPGFCVELTRKVDTRLIVQGRGAGTVGPALILTVLGVVSKRNNTLFNTLVMQNVL